MCRKLKQMMVEIPQLFTTSFATGLGRTCGISTTTAGKFGLTCEVFHYLIQWTREKTDLKYIEGVPFCRGAKSQVLIGEPNCI